MDRFERAVPRDLGGNFPISYVALERYVRRNGIEGPLDMLRPRVQRLHSRYCELARERAGCV